MSRATGDVRPVNPDVDLSPTSWAIEGLSAWTRNQVHSFANDATELFYMARTAVILIAIGAFALWLLRTLLRRSRINHYSR